MIYTNETITAVATTSVTVHNNDVGGNLCVWLPSVISRLPKVGDRIVYIKDDIDGTNGLFISYSGEAPLVFGTHVHQLLAQDTISTMALNSAQKAELTTKRTGGVA